MLDALHPDALVSPTRRHTRTAVDVLHGADHFARFFLGLAQRYGPQALLAIEPAIVNGQLGFLSHGSPGDESHPAFPGRVTAGSPCGDGKVCAVYDIANPAKLTRVRISGWHRPDPPPPTAPGTHRRN